ncbi:hypothetical protein E2C01_081027 [Portunus trituberculatus]|uniref:Uncharacterized protein n=1 Tax=Portunus trituberculatus TaxID=210409 RepID=A0A5B7IVI9_PORTR|nr:hypothetical protein [Portunus trituberculatus]
MGQILTSVIAIQAAFFLLTTVPRAGRNSTTCRQPTVSESAKMLDRDYSDRVSEFTLGNMRLLQFKRFNHNYLIHHVNKLAQ